MIRQGVAQICFDSFSRLPIVVESKDVQVSSDTGILPIRQFDDQIGSTTLDHPRPIDEPRAQEDHGKPCSTGRRAV